MAVSTLVRQVITMTTADDTYSLKLTIDYIQWVGATGAGICTLENTAGERIWAGSVDAANGMATSEKFQGGLTVLGLKAEDLPSGTLYIYIR